MPVSKTTVLTGNSAACPLKGTYRPTGERYRVLGVSSMWLGRCDCPPLKELQQTRNVDEANQPLDVIKFLKLKLGSSTPHLLWVFVCPTVEKFNYVSSKRLTLVRVLQAVWFVPLRNSLLFVARMRQQRWRWKWYQVQGNWKRYRTYETYLGTEFQLHHQLLIRITSKGSLPAPLPEKQSRSRVKPGTQKKAKLQSNQNCQNFLSQLKTTSRCWNSCCRAEKPALI